MFTFTATDVFAFNIFFPSLVCFRFRRQSFPSILLLSFVYYNENNKQRATAPVQSEEGKGALINQAFLLLFFLTKKRSVLLKIKKFSLDRRDEKRGKNSSSDCAQNIHNFARQKLLFTARSTRANRVEE